MGQVFVKGSHADVGALAEGLGAVGALVVGTDTAADAAALSIGRGPAEDAPAGSAPCDLEAPRRWFPAMEPFRVSALRPAPVLARLGLETDPADGDPIALETFSIVDNSLVWTVSAPPAGVRALSRLVLRLLNPPTPPKTSNL